MTAECIKAKAYRESALFETAVKIRALVDDLQALFPGEEDEAQERVLELVTGDDE